MIKSLANIISRIYNERLESISVRILYFFNTIDTYFLFVGILSFLMVYPADVNIIALTVSLLFAVSTAKIADFHPSFVILASPVLFIFIYVLALPESLIIKLLIVNVALFFIIQFLFMGIPDSIVARDIRVPFIKMFNSLFTVAPTTVSFSISVFFSFYLSFCLFSAVTSRSYCWLAGSVFFLLVCSVIARAMRHKNRFSKFHKPDKTSESMFERVVVLNIDGVRKDIFDSLDLPAIKKLSENGSSLPAGLETVYRALTNPAFASIFTGTVPEIHGVRDNNFGQSIKTEGLPDIVPSIAYGSMHVKHFCKKYWETRIFSLPRHSVYNSDDIMLECLKNDMKNRKEVRFFIADFNEADFLAHAYGSRSRQYKEALQRTDRRIGEFIEWMEKENMFVNTAVIVCSDHGMAAIDHSYLIAKSEKYVPCLIYGKGIKKGFQIQRQGKIMDICCTVAYMLGVRYPVDSRGQVFTEAFENHNLESEKEAFAERFNQLKYDAEAERYHCDHAEVYEGDRDWWDRCISEFAVSGKPGLRILDIGCGNGFVGERFIAMGVDFNEFICMDISENILEKAEKLLGRHPGFSFTTNLGDVKGVFDIIAVSSVFHHVVHPEKLSSAIDGLLKEGGIVIGSHEPNQEAFKNRMFNAGAYLYKRIGGGISIDDEIVMKFNEQFRTKYPGAPRVSREEILQVVEYHSPLEQYDKGVDPKSGFVPEKFYKNFFSGYDVLLHEVYTTFFHRLWLSKHKKIQLLLTLLFNAFFKQGNLFRFVLRKKKA